MIVHQTHNSLGNFTYNAFFYENCDWFYHFHKNYELIYVLDGEVELTQNNKKLLLTAHTFAVILPNEFHAYRTPKSSLVWIGVFSSDFVGEFDKLAEGKHAEDPRFLCDRTIEDFLRTYLVTETPQDLLLLKSALYAACREFQQKVQLSEATQKKGFVYDILSYVSAHFQREITLSEIAKEFGYEYHYLSRQFHRQFGINFKHFLNMYRLDFAREQLLRSDASITDIAYAAGFPTVRTFNRVFSAYNGITPSAFRQSAPRSRQMRKNSDGSLYYSNE